MRLTPRSLYALAISFMGMSASAQTQNVVSIAQSGENFEVTWAENEALYQSIDLREWTELNQAARPFVSSTIGKDREFFTISAGTVGGNTHHPGINSNNTVVAGDLVFLARGASGLEVIDLTTRRHFTALSPRVDDVATDGEFLFTLDGRGGQLSVYTLTMTPVLLSGPVRVPVSPFAGVSAASGRVVVSGGTSNLTVRTYSDTGNLSNGVASLDLGIGQPDVLISEDGARAFVSTDFAGNQNGNRFGITRIDISGTFPATPTITLSSTPRIGLSGAGFTQGSQGPANFPIESALAGEQVLVAHGGGVTVMDASSGAIEQTVSLAFFATNIDVVEDSAFVVGVRGQQSFLAELVRQGYGFRVTATR